MGRNYITYFSKILKFFFLLAVIGILTVYQQKTLAALVKLIIWILSGAKWLYYIKKNKYLRCYSCFYLPQSGLWRLYGDFGQAITF